MSNPTVFSANHAARLSRADRPLMDDGVRLYQSPGSQHVRRSFLSARSISTAYGIIALSVPLAAYAESAPAGWEWDATVYMWLPSVGGDTSFPPSSGGLSIDVSGEKILDAINFAFMGTVGARKGRWGFSTDIVYLDLGADKKSTREFALGQIEVPASVDADLQYDLTGWLWTTVGSYALVQHDNYTMDVLAGVRMLDIEQRLDWSFNGDISSLPLDGRSGSSIVEPTPWDAIVGVRGRATFGGERQWSVPYLLDIGKGDSNYTLQAIVGLGYSFDKLEVNGVWRYLEYDFGSNTPVESLSFSGPALGVTCRF